MMHGQKNIKLFISIFFLWEYHLWFTSFFVHFLFFRNTTRPSHHSLVWTVFILPLYHTPQSYSVVIKSEEDISEQLPCH